MKFWTMEDALKQHASKVQCSPKSHDHCWESAALKYVHSCGQVLVANGTSVCDGSGSVVPYEPHVNGSCCASVSAPANAAEIAAAVAMAETADVVVMAIGTNLATACEGNDADSIAIPDGQQALLDAVTKAAAKPVVVVTMTGVPLDISGLMANPKVGAILHVAVPGVQTLGIGDVIFGKRSPGGRTTQTMYPVSYQDEISIFDM